MKLTLNCQGAENWHERFLLAAKAKYIYCIGNYQKYPGIITIGRVVNSGNKEPEPLNTLISEGSRGADKVLAACWGEMSMYPEVDMWELYNESWIWDDRVLDNFIPFNQRLIQVTHHAGKKIIVGAINTGWPRLLNEDGGKMMDVIIRACQGADGLSLHEYDPINMGRAVGYTCGRYRHIVDYAAKRGYSLPSIFIVECGLDLEGRDGPSFGHYGWKSILKGNEDEYARQLLEYNKLLEADSSVECAAMFVAKPCGWDDFEITESLAMRIASGTSENGGSGVKYFDRNGNEIGESAFRSIFGNVTFSHPADSEYKVVELWDSGDNVGMDCQIYVRGGYKGARAYIVNGGKVPASVKSEEMQEVNFWACYAPPDRGAYGVFIADPVAESDTVHGLGWLCKTGHRHIQKIVFERVTGEENKPPIADFEYGVTNFIVAVDGSKSVDPDGTIVSYEWNFGDGTIVSGSQYVRTHTYIGPGVYDVKLTVTDNDGAKASQTATITISENENEGVRRLIEEAIDLLNEALEMLG